MDCFGKAVTAFNGEIYNYEYLKHRLERKFGLKMKSSCDAEILLMLTSLGDKMFEKLEGMFSIAVWDIEKQKLILSRDHVGIKPFFYFQRT